MDCLKTAYMNQEMKTKWYQEFVEELGADNLYVQDLRQKLFTDESQLAKPIGQQAYLPAGLRAPD